MFQNTLRKVGQITFSSGLSKGLDLPRRELIRYLVLRIDGRINITTLGAPVNHPFSPFNCIKRIEVIADGKDTIKSIPGTALFLKGYWMNGTVPRKTIPTWAVGNMDFSGIMIVPFAMPRAIREVDTDLNSGALSTFELKVTYGTGAEIFTTVPTAYTVTYINVDVSIAERINVEGKALNLSVFKELYIEKEVTASTQEFQMLLPVGNMYRGFLIESEAAGVPHDGVINNVQIRSGTQVWLNEHWKRLREANAVQHNLETNATIEVGNAYLDFCPEGRLVDSLNATKLSMLEAVFDVTKQTGTNYIRIYPDEIIVPMIR